MKSQPLFVSVFWLLAFLAGLGSSRAAEPKPGTLRTLTTAREAHTLTREEAASGYPVHLRAIVTYYDPYIDARHGAMFVHDASGAIFVALPPRPILPVRAGTLVDISGISSPGDYAPIVAKAEVRVVGESRVLPAAQRVTLPRLLTGAEDGQWVEVEGLVQAVRESERTVTLELAMTDGAIDVHTVKESGGDYKRLDDSKIWVRANAAPLFNKSRQMIGVQLFFPSLREVTIVEPGPGDPFVLPVSAINTLLRFAPDVTSRHRVHVRGSVTLYWPGRMICVQNRSQGLCASITQSTPLSIGDSADLVGFPDARDYKPTLTQATFRRAGGGERIAATPVSAEQALGSDHDAELVSLDGRLVGTEQTAKQTGAGNVVRRNPVRRHPSGYSRGSRTAGVAGRFQAPNYGSLFDSGGPTSPCIGVGSPHSAIVSAADSVS